MGRPSRTKLQVAETILFNSIPNGECTEYHLYVRPTGYGYVNQGAVHRVVWEALFGPTNGLWVLHKCDNRKCVNPDHLFLGTCQDNVDDMIAKGRRVNGKQLRALTEEQRIELNQLYEQGYSRKELCEIFGVSKGTVGRYLGDSYDSRR